jgi:XTP/dITP diphosphohydrolase
VADQRKLAGPETAPEEAGAALREPLRVVLATHNAGKTAEFEHMLAGRLRVVPLDVGFPLPPETGATFDENARAKAAHVFAALGGSSAVLADDSGLAVCALGGEPGVRSARYAGEAATDADNVAKLLRALSGVDERSAAFVCALALFLPGRADPIEVTAEVNGVLERTPRGTRGFGYDPIFRPQGEERTLAEMSPGEKHSVSHRGRALRALVALLERDGIVPTTSDEQRVVPA